MYINMQPVLVSVCCCGIWIWQCCWPMSRLGSVQYLAYCYQFCHKLLKSEKGCMT